MSAHVLDLEGIEARVNALPAGAKFTVLPDLSVPLETRPDLAFFLTHCRGDVVALVTEVRRLREVIGRGVDTAENLLAASTLPGLPASIHIEGLTGGLRNLRDEFRAAVPDEDSQ